MVLAECLAPAADRGPHNDHRHVAQSSYQHRRPRSGLQWDGRSSCHPRACVTTRMCEKCAVLPRRQHRTTLLTRGRRRPSRHYRYLGAGSRQLTQQLKRRLVPRIARGDKSDKSCPVLRFQIGKTGFDTCTGTHSFTPRCSATVKMSLSPRPHIFMTIR